MATTAPTTFSARTADLLSTLRDSGQYKVLQTIEGPMDAVVRLRGYGDCLCFCSNNYLGLANHPEVVEAGIKGLRDFGAGTASVRFICGTFSPHEAVERKIAELMGTESAYTFVSAWNAAEALFPTVCEPGDAIISDELNHACIIDSIRLTTAIKKGVHKAVYRNNVIEGENSLSQRQKEARASTEVNGQIWVVTDGVFSMEGSIADLPAMRRLCDQYGAILVVDDSHGHGVMGERGRGTHEHWGMCEPLGTPTLRVGSGTATHRERSLTPSQLESIDQNPGVARQPAGFVARDPYPPGMYGALSDLIQFRRNLPHLRLPGATYFVSWRCQDGVTLAEAERQIVLAALRHFDGQRARVYAACVMPDHVHWLVRPFEGHDLVDLRESVKHFAARQINRQRGATGRMWEPEGFDHIVRDGGYFAEFLAYIVRNPKEAGLASTVSGYAGLFVHPEVLEGIGPHAERGGTQVDIFTGTLGKALGGGAGGFVAASKIVTDLLIQRGRPTLFSNALPVTVACSAAKAIEILLREPQRVQRLRDNVAYARTKIKEAGFSVLESPTAICPILVHDTAKAIAMSKRLLELGVFVIGFGYPVVPEGHARLRVQISAAHTTGHIDSLVAALRKL